MERGGWMNRWMEEGEEEEDGGGIRQKDGGR